MSVKIYPLIALIFITSLFTRSAAQSTLEICAIRVEFVEDDNNLTTGNGKFNLDTTGVTPYTVDPPPHNRPYFQDQINAVSNYYRQASSGKLTISGLVFPRARDEAYQLDHTMGFYNPNESEAENNRQLAQLFIDAIQKADQAGEFLFSEFDVVTIFHAGVGKDIDLGFDETPQDIPSLYFTPEFFKRYYDPNFSGIAVDNGNTVIDRGLLLPETQTQADIEIGLTGIFAANMGSHLGMYDLFSPSEQRAGIGVFGLMDSGLFNALGLVPALPSAFSRTLMGWDVPTTLNNPQNDVPIYPFRGEQSQGQTTYRINLNSNEYFLLENRGDYQVNIDSIYFELAEGRETPPTYLEVLKTYLPDQIQVSDSTGVLLNVANYDWGLPGSGILIWHIDDLVINEKGSENRINDDKTNRAVDLEEADGSQDIGFEFTIVEPGFQSELGTWLDFYHKDNPTPLFTNEFSPSSAPNSRANRTLANSHIVVKDFSSREADIMRFSLTFNFFETGFPVNFVTSGSLVSFSSPVIGPIEYNDQISIISAASDGAIYAATANGASLLDPADYKIVQTGANETLRFALNDTNQNQIYDQLIVTTTQGQVQGYRFLDQDDNGKLDLAFNQDFFQEIITTSPVIDPPFIYFGTELGNVYQLSHTGEVVAIIPYPNPVAGVTIALDGEIVVVPLNAEIPDYPATIIDLDSDGDLETVSYPAFDRIRIDDREIRLAQEMSAEPSFGDLDADGFYEIFINSGTTIVSLNHNGSMLANFPLAPVLQSNEILKGSVLLLDADGDQQSDIIVQTSQGQIFAYNPAGRLISAFPFTLGGMVNSTPAVYDIDSDGQAELFSLTNNGGLYGWQLESAFNSDLLWWSQGGYQPNGNRYVTRQLIPTGLPVTELMPQKKAYAYPNPNIEGYTNIRYYLRESAQVNIKVFDLSGDLVTSFSGPGIGMTDNEVQWNLAGVSSGVYLCRIEAQSGGDNAVQIIKIMVIK